MEGPMSRELASFFERYAERYMAGDAAAVADLCQVPFLAVRNGAPIHLGDREAVLDHFAGLMAAYQNAGAAAADVVALDVLEQGDSAALATVRWVVRSADGAVVRDFQTSYQLLGPDPWTIHAYVNHDTVRPVEPVPSGTEG
jgi:hypothetical protein